MTRDKASILRLPAKRSAAEVKARRLRAAARQRALSRLAQEHGDRYRQLYAEERGLAS